MLPSGGALPRQVKLFGWVSLLNDFASEMIYPLLPAFVTGVLGGGAQALGALDGAAEFAAAVVKLGAGRLADRTSRRGPLIVLGYLIAVVVRPVIAVTGAAWQVIGLRVVDRLGKGLRTPPRDALIADATPADLVGRAFGLQRGMDHAGAVLGPIVAWWLLASGSAGLRTVIGASIVPGVLVLLVATWAVRGGAATGGQGAATGGKCIRVNAARCRPLPPSAARPPRHLTFLSPPHARHVDHPALAAARRAGGGGTAIVGRGARRTVDVELCGWGHERPTWAWADDVAGVARLCDPRRGNGPCGHGGGGVGVVPRVRLGGGVDREPGAGTGGPTRGGSPGERVRCVSRGDGVRGAGGRCGAGRGISAVWGECGVRRERDGRTGAGGGVVGVGTSRSGTSVH